MFSVGRWLICMSKRIRTIIHVLLSVVVLLILANGCQLTHTKLLTKNDCMVFEDKEACRRDTELAGDSILIPESDVPLSDTLNQATTVADVAQTAFNQINAIRVSNGLTALKWDASLFAAANIRAQECEQKWSHTRPNGTEYWTVDSNKVYGENLAKGYSSAESVVAAWMASASHKDNILWSNYKTGAISVYKADNGVWYWSTEFGL